MQQLHSQRTLFHLDHQRRLLHLKDWILVDRRQSLAQLLQLTQLETDYTNFEENFDDRSKALKNKIEDCFQDRRRFTNPLLILNDITADFDVKKLLQHAPLIYSRLSPYYQKELYDYLSASFAKETEAEICYAYARCFEKMKLYAEMSHAFHRAEELAPQGKYQRKLVKALEKIANSHTSLFKCIFDYKYLKNSLDVFLKDLIELDKLSASYKASETEKIDSLKEEFSKLFVKFKNFSYIYEEKSSSFYPKEHQILVRKYSKY